MAVLGADVHVLNKVNRTPLDLAIRNVHKSVQAILRTAGICINRIPYDLLVLNPGFAERSTGFCNTKTLHELKVTGL